MITNIRCGLAQQKAAPTLNEVIGEGNWKVDPINPKKVLSVTLEDLDKSQVIQAVQKAGYKAEELAQKDLL